MYTELIFGATLKEETPPEIIETLRFLIGDLKEMPYNLLFDEKVGKKVLNGSSFSFGVSKSFVQFYFEEASNAWVLNSRSSFKNYESELDYFIDWIRPYLDQGSGERNMFAIKMEENDFSPTMYYLSEY